MIKVADITISRHPQSDCTTGRLISPHLGGYIATLELPWRDNHNEISCIPDGVYPYRKAWSKNARREVIWIDDVPGRTNIQMHPGNYTRQILGCVLPGTGIADIDGDGVPDVTRSGPTLDKIMAAIPDTGTIRFMHARQPVGVFKSDNQ